jgi:hypothetical protein
VIKQTVVGTIILLFFCSMPAVADQTKLFVAGMNAVGVQNRDEMNQTLQTMLASRLNGDGLVVVGNAAEAGVLVSGTYVVIGTVFTIDAIAKDRTGKTIARVFVQGDDQDELIPAMGALAGKLTAELHKLPAQGVSTLPVKNVD